MKELEFDEFKNEMYDLFSEKNKSRPFRTQLILDDNTVYIQWIISGNVSSKSIFSLLIEYNENVDFNKTNGMITQARSENNEILFHKSIYEPEASILKSLIEDFYGKTLEDIIKHMINTCVYKNKE